MKFDVCKIVLLAMLAGLVSPLLAPRSLHRSRRAGVATLRVRPRSCDARVKAPLSVASSCRSAGTSVSASDVEILGEVSELVIGLSKAESQEAAIKKGFYEELELYRAGHTTVESLRAPMLAWLRCVAGCSQEVQRRFSDELVRQNSWDYTFCLKDRLAESSLYKELAKTVRDFEKYISRLSTIPSDQLPKCIERIFASEILG